MIMEQPPAGYPPPTLIRRRSPKRRLALLIVLVLAAAALGALVVSRITETGISAPPLRPTPAGGADSSPAAPADAVRPPAAVEPAEPPVTVDNAAADAPAKAANARDGREANLWYYVRRLGDGPGAIYSRDGRRWSFAFACTTRTRTIEFIAVGTGSPGDFDRQSMRAGRVGLEMDATYSKDGGGIISTRLAAAHPIFDALAAGKDPLEVQLVASHKTILPVGPGLVRLIGACRGHA